MAVRTDETEAPAPGEDMLTPAVDPADPFAAELYFTEVYRAHADSHVAVREAACLRAQYPGILEPIEPGDLLAGRIRPRLVGFTPDEWGGCAFGYYHMPQAIREALERHPLDADRFAVPSRRYSRSGTRRTRRRACVAPTSERWRTGSRRTTG
ncbi:MAG: hypothetical protein ACXVP7_00345 [Actinomycetota bacterium]